LLLLEARFPLRRATRSKTARFAVNAGISLLALATGALLVAPVATHLSARASETSFGLLKIIPLPFGAEFILGFLLMDLTFYYWHRANHVVPLLWRFHNVHHVDPDLDVTTSFRFHFLEVLYSIVFRALQVYLIGISAFTYLVYSLVFQLATLFHHSNLRLPIAVERALNNIFVTPRMHGVHHSNLKDQTNSNYSVIFRWWDLLHGTLILNVRQADLDIGVPAYLDPESNKFFSLLALPFRKQKDYWEGPSTTPTGGNQRTGRNTILLP